MMIEIILNGEKRHFAESTSIERMLESLNIRPSVSVVEYNGEILDRVRYAQTDLRNCDKIEVVRMVCGG